MGEKPNVLFITADQWRADAFGRAYPDLARTPHIDTLAGEGIWFSNHYVQTAPCGPSRTTLHTGLYPQQHGSWRNGMAGQGVHDNWATRVAAAGYDARLVGYTHTAAEDGRRGFEGLLPGLKAEGEHRVDQSDWARWLIGRGVDGVPEPSTKLLAPRPDRAGYSGTYSWGRSAFGFAESDTAYLAELACAFMARDSPRPWMLHVTFFRPHDPYVVSPEFALPELATDAFPRRGPSLAEALAAHPYLAAQRRSPRALPPAADATLLDMRRHYLASTSEMDAGVGLLLRGLADLGLEDRTVIILTSDHGDQLGDHWLMGKLGPHDQSFHVPLIVRDPRREADVTRGKRIDDFTLAIDIAPTLVDYAGAPPLTASHGRSLRPAVEGRNRTPDRGHARWFYDYGDVMPNDGGHHRLSVIRTRDTLYAEFDDFDPLLIDLDRDGEDLWTNRARDEGYATRRAGLTRWLRTAP